MSSDWYDRLREDNPWLPPANKVLDAEVTLNRDSMTMDLRVVLAAVPTWAGVLPPLAAERAWAGVLVPLPRPALNALPNALVHLAQAMAASGDGRNYRAHLTEAGAQVRAMAPADQVWSAAYQPESRDPRALLREAVADVVQAADWQGRKNPERAERWLRAADAILHGLWLGAR